MLGNCSQALTDAATVTRSPHCQMPVFLLHRRQLAKEITLFLHFSGTPNAIVTYNDGMANQTITLDPGGNASLPVTAGNTDLFYSLTSASLNGCTQLLFDRGSGNCHSGAPLLLFLRYLRPLAKVINIVFTFFGTPNALVTYNDGSEQPGAFTRRGRQFHPPRHRG